MRKACLWLWLLLLAAAGWAEPPEAVTFRTRPSGLAVFWLAPDKEQPEYLGVSGEPLVLPSGSKDLRIVFGVKWNDGSPPFYERDAQNRYVVHTVQRTAALKYGSFPPRGEPAIAVDLDGVRLRFEWGRLRYWAVTLGLAVLAWLALMRWQKPRQLRRQQDEERLRRLDTLKVSIESADPRLMSRIGDFRLVKRLGRGGMATVYKALPEATLEDAEAVAVKLIRPEEAASPEFRKRFMREVEVCSKLHHPHIVKVLDSGDQEGVLYIVMELIAGDTLRRRISKGGMPLKEVRKLAEPIFSAIQYAHEQGVVHRDLKPDNIMVTGTSRVVVMDFGLARRHDFSTVTATGSVLGTPAYMAPEQMQGDSMAHSTDQYSLGVMVYEMLSGQLPFEASDPVQLILKHITEAPAPLRKHNPRLSEALDGAVLRMLEKDPQRRFASVGAAWQELSRHLA